MIDPEFFVVLDGAYPRVPYAGRRKSNFVDLPNRHYDPVVGQRVLEDQLETAAALEDLGFDGVVVSEQHNGPIGVLGNPMIAGGWIAARTRRMKIGVIGSIVNDYLTPIRLAEEIATVDTMSRGRLIVGLPMGHGMQYHSTGVMNTATGRARYREAHDLLLRAMTEPGPFEFKGDFLHVPYVNLWPRPLQQPHPPIWIPGGGSVETLRLVAKHRYTYLAVLSPRPALLKTMARLRELCLEEGYEAAPHQIAQNIAVHVAESDAQARREVEAHELWVYQNFFRSPMHDNFPPGYTSAQSLANMLEGGYRSKPLSELTYDEIVDMGWLVAGAPETVASRLRELMEEAGTGRLVIGANNGSKPRWLALKSLTMFAEEVVPRLRPGGSPTWKDAPVAAYETNTEYGARRPADDPPPTVAGLVDGALVDVSTAHVEELRRQLEPWPPA
jgi:alkanesulfonate monooxygenase SsuD/methylene tetrahydromethanopterin reductase-like flavin-dependent oxidoreductase (luciferase family)